MASDGGGGGALDGEGGWGIRKASQPQLQQLDTTTITTTTTTTSPGDVGRGGYGGSSYGGGGKSRASRLKSGKKGLPYERPSIGRSAASGPQAAAILSAASTRALAGKAQGTKAWLGSGFSKIISTGATYLYSSMFRRNNPALPAPLPVLDVEAQEPDEDEQISFPTVDPDNNQGGNEQNGLAEKYNHVEPLVANSSNSDVEKLLAKRTLSRDEFQRLTDLLQSRVVSNGVEKKQQPKHVEFDIRSSRQDVHLSGGNQSEAQRWRQDLQKSREERENSVRTLTVYENGGPSSATQAGVPESLDALSSSPVDVAIAFMGGRGSRLGETLPMEPLNQRDENLMSSGPPPSVNAPQTSLAKWSAPDFLNEDQFGTPPPPTLQSWGRHRTTSRTPYSRPLRLPPSRERAIDGLFGTPSATRWTPIRTPVTGGRELLKRRSTVLDEGWTSGGPIRRTRHKAIVSGSPSNLSQSRGFGFQASPLSSSSLLSLPSPIGGKRSAVSPSSRNVSPSATKEKSALTPSGNFYVPAQSSATARKILETLEKMTPSPKGKSLGDELAFLRERPPTALTEGMLNDQARKSMTFVEYASPSDSREPGPSGRTAEESLSSGYPGSSFKISDSSTKVKGKGKGPLPSSENGPSGPGGLLKAQERTGTADGSVKETSARPKEPVTVTAPANSKGKGFRMSAVFEESGSEDEGRKSMSPPPMSTPKLPTTSSVGSIVIPSVFRAAKLSPSGVGLLSFPASVPAVDTSKAFSSGFSFPTRASLEGPPTPKAMSPASTSPKANTATPLFPFAQAVEPPAASGSTTEASSTPVKAESQPETKTEFSFGSPAPVAYAAQAVSISQPSLEFSKSIFKQSSLPQASSSAFAPPVLPAFTTGGGTNTSAAPTSSKLGDTLSAPVSSTSFKVAAVPSNATPFGQLLTSNSSSAQSASVTVASTNLFSSSTGSGTAPAVNLFASGFKPGTSAPPAFGQLNSFAFKNLSSTSGPLVSPDSKTSGGTDNTIPLVVPERPQKRSMSSFQQDLGNQQQPPSHVFTSFGITLATSAATPAIPVTFAAGGQSTSASQGLFVVPSFGQASGSASQTATPLPSAVGIPPFPFGSSATSAGTTSSASSSAGFGSTPSFPSFPSSVFGTVSSGSTFGITPAPAPVLSPAPLAFGSTATTPAFGSTISNSLFGGFASEAVSQSPPTPVFGSGFTSPSPSPSTSSAFSFGASSPAFSFGPSAASSSGSAFTFGSAGSFPFAANKSSPPSPVFGLSSSVPAFGSTTNGTMANDVVVNEQSNMDDNSMAEEPSQMGGSVSPQPSIFGAQSNAGAGSFVFGAQAGATVQPLFGGFSNLTNPAGFGAAPANPFAAQPAGSLDFAGGSFTLGSSGDNRPQRKMFKAKRTGAKRGK